MLRDVPINHSVFHTLALYNKRAAAALLSYQKTKQARKQASSMSSLNHRTPLNRPATLYPPRAFQAPQQPRPVRSNAFFSKQSVIVLGLGIMFGYILLPILMVQHLGFDDLPIQGRTASPSIELHGVHAIGSLKPANKAATATGVPSRILFTDDEKIDVKEELVDTDNTQVVKEKETNNETEETKEEQTPPDEPEVQDEDQEKEETTVDNEKADVVTEEKAAVVASSDTKAAVVSAAAVPSIKKIIDFNDAEKRIMEDRDILSRQSIPTATSPHIMSTASLPDHHRKKILVTGGAGFVGSHLVDKLMQEGHEVIVVDNFFTGQKKNIAHWLHHPNFR
jgi:FlaA1/EpsC-like NDP-sugar epimerase